MVDTTSPRRGGAVALLLTVVLVAAALAVPSPAGAQRRVAAPAITSGGGVTVVASTDAASVVEGAVIHLQVTVINTGGEVLHGVGLVEGSVPGCAPETFDLAVGAAATIECDYLTGAPDVGTLALRAEVSAAELAEPVVSNQVEVQVLAASPALVVVLSADDLAVVEGSAFGLRVTLVNTGNLALHGAGLVEDSVPGCAPEPLDLVVGGVATLECEYVTAAADVGTLSLTAQVAAAELAEPATSNVVTVAVEAAAPGLSVLNTVDEAALRPGDTVHHHVTLTNTGNVVLHAATITAPAAPTCEVVPFDLAIGETVTVDCDVITSTSDIGPYRSEVTVTVDELVDPVVADPVEVLIEEVPGLSVVVSADEAAVVHGEAVHLHVSVVNTGNVVLHGVTVAEVGVAGCEVAPFDLAVGADLTVDCEYVTVAEDVGEWSAGATVTVDELVDPVVAESLVVPVAAQAPSLSVVVSADEAAVVHGETVHLHVSVVNTGNVVLHGVTVAEVGVAGCEVAPFDLAVGADLTVDCEYVTVAEDVGEWSAGATVTVDELVDPVVAEPLVVPVAAQAPSLAATLSADETEVIARARIHLHVTLVNTGNVALHAVTVVDAGVPSCEVAPFDLAVGQSTTVDCFYLTTVADVGPWSNSASATADEVPDPVTTGTVEVEVLVRTGRVAGEVTDSVTGEPVDRVLVALLSQANFALAGIAETSSEGAYEVTAPIGRFFVYVVDPAMAYRSAFFGDPSAVTIAPATTTPVDQQLTPAQGSFSGRITDSVTGDPIEDVVVVGVDVGTGRPSPGAVTDASGAYTVSGLPEGVNRAMFAALSGSHESEYWDDETAAGASHPIAVTGGANTGSIDASLEPRLAAETSSNFVGTVTNAEGTPLEGIAVAAVGAADYRVETGVITDANGAFDLPVSEGDYKVTYYDISGTFQQTWFDGLPYTAVGDAAVVAATAGEATTVDAELTPVGGSLGGTVTDAGSEAPLEGAVAIAVRADGALAGTATTAADGSYTIDGLLPGEYRVCVLSIDGQYATQYQGGGSSFLSAAVWVITAGALTDGADAAMVAAVDAEGVLDQATLLLRASSVGAWDGANWSNEGLGGPALDATRLSSAVTFVPAGQPNGPGFRIPSVNPGGGVAADDGFAVPGGGALAESMDDSFTVTVAFTPLYSQVRTERFYRKYTGTNLVSSGTGFVIEDTPEVGGLIVAVTATPDVGVALIRPMVSGRQVITFRIDRQQERFTVVRNGQQLHSESITDVGAVMDLADLIVGPGQFSHTVAWHDRALSDAEVDALHAAL